MALLFVGIHVRYARTCSGFCNFSYGNCHNFVKPRVHHDLILPPCLLLEWGRQQVRKITFFKYPSALSTTTSSTLSTTTTATTKPTSTTTQPSTATTSSTCAPLRCLAPCNKGVVFDKTGCPHCLCWFVLIYILSIIVRRGLTCAWNSINWFIGNCCNNRKLMKCVFHCLVYKILC